MGTRTNIVLDDKLVKRAMKATGAKTKREVVDIALHRLVQDQAQMRAQRSILDLVGKGLIDPDYDIRSIRTESGRGARR
ncbi:MAG: type II toxin-antitoxin system VapB family antitoxin [Rhodanobacteraceae bacterium]